MNQPNRWQDEPPPRRQPDDCGDTRRARARRAHADGSRAPDPFAVVCLEMLGIRRRGKPPHAPGAF